MGKAPPPPFHSLFLDKRLYLQVKNTEEKIPVDKKFKKLISSKIEEGEEGGIIEVPAGTPLKTIEHLGQYLTLHDYDPPKPPKDKKGKGSLVEHSDFSSNVTAKDYKFMSTLEEKEVE